jgi:hypothetical protein
MFKINSATKSKMPGTSKRTVLLLKTARFQGFSKSGFHVRLVKIDSVVVGPSEYPPQQWQRYGTAVLNCVLSFRAARMSGNRRRFRPAERPQLAGKRPLQDKQALDRFQFCFTP